MSKKSIQTSIREVQSKLASIEKECYASPEAASVRPAISQASKALNAVGFREQVERLEV